MEDEKSKKDKVKGIEDMMKEFMKQNGFDFNLPNEFGEGMEMFDVMFEKFSDMLPEGASNEERRKLEENKDMMRRVTKYLKDPDPSSIFDIIRIGLSEERGDAEDIFKRIFEKRTPDVKKEYDVVKITDRGDFYSAVIEVPSDVNYNDLDVNYTDSKIDIRSADFTKEFEVGEYAERISGIEETKYNNGFLTIKLRKVINDGQ